MHSSKKYRFPISKLAIISVSILLLFSELVSAQELVGLQSVAQRYRPGLEADGVPVGAMTLYPQAGVEAVYIDNVFATQNGERDDVAMLLTPEARLRSITSRYRAEIGASAEVARYSKYDSENYEDLRFWTTADTAFGINEVSADLRLSELHEPRTSPDAVAGSKLTEFSDRSVALDYTYRPGRLFASADGRLRRLNFSDTDAPGGGKIDNHDRDRDITELGGRLGYSLSPDLAVYGELRGDGIEYDQRTDDNGYQRSSDGVQLRAGTLVEITDLISGEFYLGYEKRDYDDARFSDIDAFVFGGDVMWNLTQLTTITAEAHRRVDPTTIVGASGVLITILGAGIDHELRRNLILNANLSFIHDDFEGISREDDIVTLELGGRYLMNRYAYVDFGYGYSDRDTSPSSSTGIVYTINEVFLRIVAQL